VVEEDDLASVERDGALAEVTGERQRVHHLDQGRADDLGLAGAGLVVADVEASLMRTETGAAKHDVHARRR
jgi:hypothetical protein